MVLKVRTDKTRHYLYYRKQKYYGPKSLKDKSQEKLYAWLLKQIGKKKKIKAKVKAKLREKKGKLHGKPEIKSGPDKNIQLEKGNLSNKQAEDSTAVLSLKNALRAQQSLPPLSYNQLVKEPTKDPEKTKETFDEASAKVWEDYQVHHDVPTFAREMISVGKRFNKQAEMKAQVTEEEQRLRDELVALKSRNDILESITAHTKVKLDESEKERKKAFDKKAVVDLTSAKKDAESEIRKQYNKKDLQDKAEKLKKDLIKKGGPKLELRNPKTDKVERPGYLTMGALWEILKEYDPKTQNELADKETEIINARIAEEETESKLQKDEEEEEDDDLDLTNVGILKKPVSLSSSSSSPAPPPAIQSVPLPKGPLPPLPPIVVSKSVVPPQKPLPILPPQSPVIPPRPLVKGKGADEGMSNIEIDKFMKSHKSYLGTIASDEIESKILPQLRPGMSQGSFIMNMDKSDQPGSHWVAVYFTPRAIEYYNPLADPPTENFRNEAKKIVQIVNPDGFMLFKKNNIQRQSNDTKTCGYHAMKFIIDRENGKSYADATGFSDHKKDDHVNGEKAVDKFIHHMTGDGFEFIHGDGIIDTVKEVAGKVVKRISDVWKGVRQRASPSIRKFLETNGDAKITKIIIGRQVVTPMVEKVASWLSLGKYDENKKKLSYDKMMHLFMIITLDNGKTFKLEKNHLPEISITSNAGNDTMAVKAQNISLNEFFGNAEKKAGGTKLWIYDAITQNCQYFVKWCLQGAGVWTDELNKFVMQDAGKVIEGLSWFQKIARKLTDTANVLDVAKEGNGKKQRFKEKIKKVLKRLRHL